MISVPAALKAEIQRQTKRHLKARVRIDYSDANIDSTIIAWAGTVKRGSYLAQAYNGKEDVSEKYAMLDGNWILDGSWHLAPETDNEQERFEIGWHGTELSKDDGTFQDADDASYLLGDRLLGDSLLGEFVDSPHLSVNFIPRTISDIRISFDNARMEYGVDFDVILYAQDGTELDRISVTGNSGVKYVHSISAVNQVAQMTLRIKKWSEPNTCAKVAEIFTSVSELYEDGDILNLQVIENRELSDDGVPLGTTASGQVVLQLFNRFRRFDGDQPTSKLFNLIRKGVRIRPELGDGTNWVPLGVFFASTWDIPKNDIIVTVSGLDRMALMAESEYKSNVILEAPADENYLTDTTAEWSGGTFDGAEAGTNNIRMSFS